MSTQQGIQIRSGLVGQILGISHPTIQKWVKKGLVRIVARTPGGHALFDFAEVEQLRRRLEAQCPASISPIAYPESEQTTAPSDSRQVQPDRAS